MVLPDIRAFYVASAGADTEAAVAADPSLRLMGFTVSETNSAVAHFRVMNGATVSGGTNVASVKLASGGFEFVWFGPDGIKCPDGITLDRVAGTCEFVLYYRRV